MQDATCWCGFGGVRRPCLACLLNERRRVRAAAAARARVDRCAPQRRAAAEEPQRHRRGLGRVARGALVLRLLLLPAMLLLGLAAGAGTPVRFEEQLKIMAKEKPGRASEAGRSIEFVVTDTMRHEHTHTLEIADPKHGATPRWYVESTMIGAKLHNLFVVKDRGAGESTRFLSSDPGNKYMLPFKAWLADDVTYACAKDDEPPAQWTVALPTCGQAIGRYGTKAECGCALKWARGKSSRRMLIGATSAVKLLAIDMLRLERDGLLEDARTAYVLDSAGANDLHRRAKGVAERLGVNLPPVSRVITSLDDVFLSDMRRSSMPADLAPDSPGPAALDVGGVVDFIAGAEDLEDDDLKKIYAALCSRSPAVCQADSSGGLTHTAAVRNYTVEALRVAVRAQPQPDASIVRNLTYQDTFDLRQGRRGDGGAYSTKVKVPDSVVRIQSLDSLVRAPRARPSRQPRPGGSVLLPP